MQTQKNYYNLSTEEIFANLNSRKEGLFEQEWKEKQKIFGKNIVQKPHSWSWLALVKNQFNNALVWILLIAAVLSFIFGEYRDTTIILIIVGINATIGFFQEFKAERTLENIRKLASDRAKVIRDGKVSEINAMELVPGDVISVAAGDRVPADAYLIEGFDVYVNEFIFTGESKPSKKISGKISEENLPLSDRDNMIFMGTSLTRGQLLAVVTGIGMETELGKIANLVTEVREEETPLQKQMRVLGRDVTILSLLIAVLVLIAGYYYKLSWYDNFLFALALSVSVVPEGLPAAISVALSIGMRKLLKHNVLAKKLNAVETLASVSIICTDKTGTITRNELMVTDIVIGDSVINVDGEGYCPDGKFLETGRIINQKEIPGMEMLMRIGALCNDSSIMQVAGQFQISGDPTEGALLVAAEKYHGELATFTKDFKKVTEIPFSSERMRMVVVAKNTKDGKIFSFVKGSPDVMIDLCTKMVSGDKIVAFSEDEKEKVKRNYNAMSKRALRVLAFAYREIDEETDCLSHAENDLVWTGLMGMIDPPRKEVRAAIEECQSSGIKVIMITGDYEITAQAIAKDVGLIKSTKYEVINGKTLEGISDALLYKKIRENDVVFARITPEQKLRIATVLKSHGAVIAMTGDGVNDAPALKKADIGVAMGAIGTDVAKEASDMILIDDNFASIVRAVKQGRTIYQNLRKFVHYVFTSNASEFFTVVIGALLQIPSPIVAVQILAVDLGTDIFPSFSLSLEPSEPTVMKQKPFNPKEKVLGGKGFWRIIQLGLIMATGAVIAFILSMKRGGWDFGNKFDAQSVLYIKSTSAAYAVLAMSQMANLLQSRSETLSVFAIGFFKNKYAISVSLLLAFQYVPLFQKYLHMSPIDWQDWLVVMVTTIVVFVFEEARKAEKK